MSAWSANKLYYYNTTFLCINYMCVVGGCQRRSVQCGGGDQGAMLSPVLFIMWNIRSFEMAARIVLAV